MTPKMTRNHFAGMVPFTPGSAIIIPGISVLVGGHHYTQNYPKRQLGHHFATSQFTRGQRRSVELQGCRSARSVTAYPQDVNNGHIKQWNITLERQFKDTGFRLSYVGSHNYNM